MMIHTKAITLRLFKSTLVKRYKMIGLIALLFAITLFAQSWKERESATRVEMPVEKKANEFVIFKKDPKSRVALEETSNQHTAPATLKPVETKAKFNLSSAQVFLHNRRFASDFDRIMDAECSVSNLRGQAACLNKLVALDQSMQEFRASLGNYDPCNDCVQENGKKRLVHIHTFWHLTGPDELNMRVLRLNLMSYLATQNLCCTKFIMWKLRESAPSVDEKVRREFDVYIKRGVLELKTFDMQLICAHDKSKFRNGQLCAGNKGYPSLAGNKVVGLSDFVRFAVLDIYEGIYVDGDVFFLKDMQLLWSKSFAYRWSYTNNYNTGKLESSCYVITNATCIFSRTNIFYYI